MVLAAILANLFGFQGGVLGKSMTSCYQGRELFQRSNLLASMGRKIVPECFSSLWRLKAEREILSNWKTRSDALF